MRKRFLVVTADEEFGRTLLEATHLDLEKVARVQERISATYQPLYSIEDNLAEVEGKHIHVCFLPGVDTMRRWSKQYKQPEHIMGSALYAVQNRLGVKLVEPGSVKKGQDISSIIDPVVGPVYELHRPDAEAEATRLLAMTEDIAACALDNDLRRAAQLHLLKTAFNITFGHTYTDWRKSLQAHGDAHRHV